MEAALWEVQVQVRDAVQFRLNNILALIWAKAFRLEKHLETLYTLNQTAIESLDCETVSS